MKIVCMAGGGGTRLWPVSTDDFPKQFLSLGFDRSLIQQTYDRVKDICAHEDFFITANKKYDTLLEKQLAEIPKENFFYEPTKRDNAAASALTLKRLMHLGFADEVMVMLPSDHHIQNVLHFNTILQTAEQYVKAHNEYILTIGIQPEYPETGYGYIESTDELLDTINDLQIKKVQRFTEKPDKETAESFIEQGNFFWNSGMFIWHIGTMWKLFETYLPEITSALDKLDAHLGTSSENVKLDEIYPELRAVSIDFGIMEKTPYIGVIPTENLQWTDIGNWASMMKLYPPDEQGNINLNNAVITDTENSFSFGDGKKIHVFGGKNLGIIQTDNKIFILDLDKSSDIKTFLKNNNI